MPLEDEIRLALAFTTFLVIIVLFLSFLWWSENRSDRSVLWLMAGDAAILVAVAGALLSPDASHPGAVVMASGGVVFSSILSFICLLRASGNSGPVWPFLASGGAITGLHTVLYLQDDHRAETGLAVICTLMAALLLVCARVIWRYVEATFNAPLAIVLMTPLAALGTLFLALLGAVVLADQWYATMFGGAVILGFGVSAISFLFSLAHLRNNQDARALTSARIAAEAASDAKSGFLMSISHEFRTPLNAIIGLAELMQNPRSRTPVERFPDFAGQIHLSGRHLLGLVENLLEFTSAASGRSHLTEDRVAPAAIVEEAFAQVSHRARERGIMLASEVPQETPEILADRRRLIQVIVNLLTNAIKASASGARVTVHVHAAPSGVGFAIQDSGTGMSATGIANALTPFGQNRTSSGFRGEGLGIGLPLAWEIMHAHDGDLLVESTPGAGTTVRAVIPAARIVAAEAGQAEAPVARPANEPCRPSAHGGPQQPSNMGEPERQTLDAPPPKIH